MIIHLLVWTAALALFAVAVHSASRLVRVKGEWRMQGSWLNPALFASAALILLTLIRVVSPLTAGVIGGITAVTTVLVLRGADKPWFTFRANITGAFSNLLGDLGAIAGHGRPGGRPMSPSTEAVHAAVGTRAIPSVREDPALGPAPEPAAVATIAPVPAVYAALAEYIRSFEAADDMELRMFMEGNAAGEVAVADAWHAQGDVLLNSNGLHPAYIAGILEVGDSKAEGASFISQVHKRFAVIYGAVKEWIGSHGPLPHRAREFLTGEDAA